MGQKQASRNKTNHHSFNKQAGTIAQTSSKRLYNSLCDYDIIMYIWRNKKKRNQNGTRYSAYLPHLINAIGAPLVGLDSRPQEITSIQTSYTLPNLIAHCDSICVRGSNIGRGSFHRGRISSKLLDVRTIIYIKLYVVYIDSLI